MKKLLKYVLGLLLLLAFLVLFFNPVFNNIIRYGDSGVSDYMIFPSRTISRSMSSLEFKKDTTPITRRFINLQNEIGLDKLLEQQNTLSFIIIQNDTIIFERYYNRADTGYFSMYFSMTKSVMSLLIGCAIDDKLISSENDAVTQYIPEFKNKGFNNITILDLLDMQAPLNYVENSNPFGKHVKFYYDNKLEKDILKLTVNENNEKEFVYRSGDYAILGLILKRVLKSETISQYLERKIWIPLGMENQGIFSIDHENDGIEKCWCCLAGTARDFLRIASVYLHKGRFNDKQIVSKDWITKTLSPLYDPGNKKEYSYGWWLYPDTQSFMAIGKDGQFAYINPAKSIIIIRLGENSGHLKRRDWYKLFSKIAETL